MGGERWYLGGGGGGGGHWRNAASDRRLGPASAVGATPSSRDRHISVESGEGVGRAVHEL